MNAYDYYSDVSLLYGKKKLVMNNCLDSFSPFAVRLSIQEDHWVRFQKVMGLTPKQVRMTIMTLFKIHPVLGVQRRQGSLLDMRSTNLDRTTRVIKALVYLLDVDLPRQNTRMASYKQP
jgi:hypothetical protein